MSRSRGNTKYGLACGNPWVTHAIAYLIPVPTPIPIRTCGYTSTGILWVWVQVALLIPAGIPVVMPTVAVAGNMVYGQTVALIFTNSDSGEDYITVDGNEGDHNNLTAWHNGIDF
ncbi:hypothetical protein P692DRAFT_20875177 [Suillus brevipes Sb2]|nr:hypothetical protein P692DRAFT_20875177 [Suillus brevipes Sb2]